MKGQLLCGVVAGLSLVATGCGGVAFVDSKRLCEGPLCHLECEVDKDCPAPAVCRYGHCSGAQGGDGVGGGSGSGGSGGVAPGDLIIILDDGRITWGDAAPPGDNDPGSGDLAAGGDADHGDTALSGDVLVHGDDGTVCMDPDLDGYCECCPLGPDCPGVGCPGGNPGCGEYDELKHPGVIEVCDSFDNNCDGVVDEGVKNGCGSCAGPDYCVEDTPWTDGNAGSSDGTLPGPDADPGPGSCLPTCIIIDGVVTEGEDPNGFGAITLAEGTVATDFAWGANEIEGTVSRVDTILGQEVGRFTTVLWRADDYRRPYVQPWGPPGSRCAEPSRTTIDGDGNAFVANRAVSGYQGACDDETDVPKLFGSVTKIAYFSPTICDHGINPDLVGCQCVDRNDNGVIETSFDHDASRSIDLSGVVLSGCVTLDPEQVPHEVSMGPDCSTACVNDDDCVAALGERHFCVNNACSDRPQRPEFLGVDDECLMWTLRIPGAETNADPDARTSSSPRGMAIDRDGFVWVGDDTGASPHMWKIKAEPPSPSYPRGRGVFVCPRAAGCCRDGDDCSGADTPIAWNAECARTPRQASNRAVVRADPASQCTAVDPCIWTVDDSCRIDVTAPPYGAVIDSGESHPHGYGYLWFTHYNRGYLQRLDTETGAVSKRFRATDGSVWGSAYGISIDHEDRPWIVQSHTTTLGSRPTALRFEATTRDPNGKLIENFVPGTSADPDPSDTAQAPLWSIFRAATGDLPDGRPDPWDATNFYGRGITTELLAPANPGDPVSSRIWATFNNGWNGNSNWILTFDAVSGVEDTVFRTNASPGPNDSDPCRDPIGIGMGFEEKVWVVNQNSYSMCAFDPWGPLASGGGMERVHHAPIGLKPYTYSDFTGSILRSFTNPEGRYKVLVSACRNQFELAFWGAFRWRAEVPGQSVLEVRFRFGDTVFEAMNVGAPQIAGPVLNGPLSPAQDFEWTPDPFEDRIYCEIEFRFLADKDGLAPVLYSVESARNCEPSG